MSPDSIPFVPKGHETLDAFLARKGLSLSPEERIQAEAELDVIAQTMGQPVIREDAASEAIPAGSAEAWGFLAAQGVDLRMSETEAAGELLDELARDAGVVPIRVEVDLGGTLDQVEAFPRSLLHAWVDALRAERAAQPPAGYRLSETAIRLDRAISLGNFSRIEARLVRLVRERMRPDHVENGVYNAALVRPDLLASCWRVEGKVLRKAVDDLVRDGVLARVVPNHMVLFWFEKWATTRLAPEDRELANVGEPEDI